MISLKNYFKETSVKVKKFALVLKSLIATAAGTSFVQGDIKIAFYVAVGGAVIAGLLELLPPDDPAAPAQGAPSAGGVAAAMLGLFILFGISGCTVLKPEVDRTKTDTTITTYKQVALQVKGATVSAGLNLDSLYHVALMNQDIRKDDSIQRLNAELKYKRDSIAALKANKPIPAPPVIIQAPPKKQYVTDPQTKAQLAYWIDAYGKFQITCQAKDQTIQTLQAQVTKLTKDTTTTTKVVTQTPWWNKLLMITESVIILALAIFLLIKTIL